MMKLSSIRIQGMHNVVDKTYKLNNMNYFVGPNGAGKSTVMQAIQLALLGYIPGTDKKKSAIFQHSNGYAMSVSLVISDSTGDITITRTWTRKGKNIEAQVITEPMSADVEAIIGDISLPILNFSEFISMTSNKLKDWFINFLPNSESSIDWDSKLRQGLSSYGKILNPDFVTETVDYVTGLESHGLDQIRDFNAYLKQTQSAKKAELTRVQGTIQSLIFYDDCDTSADVAELNEQNHNDTLLRDILKQQVLRIAHNKKIDAQLKTFTEVICDSLESDERYKFNLKTIEDANATISKYEETTTDLLSTISVLNQQRVDKQSVIAGAGVCPYSGTVCDSIKQMLSVFEADIKVIDAELAKCNEELQAARIKVDAAKKNKFNCERQNNLLVSQYKQVEALRKQYDVCVGDLDENVLQINIPDIESRIKSRNDMIIKIEANKQYSELTTKLTAQKFQIEQEIEILKDWIKLTDVNGMQSDIMKAPFNKLAGKMSMYLNKFFGSTDLTAAFHLTQEANSFSFGIRKADDTYIEFDLLSSGEKCLYTLSLMLGLIETSNTQLPILLIDDLLDHLDTSRITSCFETLYSIDNVQVLLAGVQNSPIDECTVKV
jgi:DNA repair exonuclease SbcCD ATPase subunit|nr:MAG TPA: STRUCTURAL MAINTENANCE OF CHROMOSOMES PROTEIN [Caudoviricetes sp.]